MIEKFESMSNMSSNLLLFIEVFYKVDSSEYYDQSLAMQMLRRGTHQQLLTWPFPSLPLPLSAVPVISSI